jgi:Dolichyl-phosphate-mannose-protein mannosyltransferase
LLYSGFWRDEASTYYDVAQHGLAATLAMIVRIELAPPAYFLVEQAWTHLFGSGTVAMKLPSFIAGLLLVVVCYALGRVAASSRAGLFAAAFACISLPAIDLSGEARIYAFSALVSAAALTAYAVALRSEKPIAPLIWFGALGIVLAYSNYAGCVLLALLAVATIYLLRIRPEPQERVGFASAFAAIALAYIPWLPTMLEHARIGAPFQERTRLDTFFNVVNNDLGHLWPFASRHGQLGIALALGGAIWVALAFRRSSRGGSFSRPGAVAAFAFCTVAGAVTEALLSLREPRYIFVFAPAAWVWFAWLADRFFDWLPSTVRWQKIAFAGLAVVLLALFIPSERAARNEGPPIASGIRDLAPQAIALGQHNRVMVVVAPDYLGPTMGYYYSRVTGAPVYGYARWSDPQIFVTKGYQELWSTRGLARAARRHIRAWMTGPDARLVLVRDNILIDRARMHYTRANRLIAWIWSHYRLLSSVEFPGRDEDVIMEVFAPRMVHAAH